MSFLPLQSDPAPDCTCQFRNRKLMRGPALTSDNQITLRLYDDLRGRYLADRTPSSV
jgi:hypothetical protein